MAARMPMMATTIMSSMRVKPRWLPSTVRFLCHRLIMLSFSLFRYRPYSAAIWKLAYLLNGRSTQDAMDLTRVTSATRDVDRLFHATKSLKNKTSEEACFAQIRGGKPRACYKADSQR